MFGRLLKDYFEFRKERKHFRKYLDQKEEIDQYVLYLELGTHLPVTHQVKQNNILKYKNENLFSTLVETGTYLGDMVEAQKNNFKHIISIELSKELYEQAVIRFEMDPHIQIMQGDSGAVLREVIKDIQEPALFWLDGHYSSGFTAKTDKNTPILEELRAIFNSPYNHGVLIDDARLFNGQDDYPSIDQVCDLVKALSPQRTVEVADDIIRIMEKSTR